MGCYLGKFYITKCLQWEEKRSQIGNLKLNLSQKKKRNNQEIKAEINEIKMEKQKISKATSWFF